MKDDYSTPPVALLPGARVWIYLRDSGGPSQEQSIEQQEHELIAYCKKYNFVLEKSFRDVAKSGSSIDGRDQFNLMIEQSEDKHIRPQAILIYDLARFARNSIDASYFKSKLRRNKIVIHSIKDHIPEDEFAGRIVETVLDLATEDSRRRTSEYVKRGLKALVSKGFSPGNPPRGYIGVKVTIGEKRDGHPRIVSKWERDPVLGDYAVLAWELRAQGKSYKEITAATKGKLYKSVGTWATFFRNKSYLGYYGDMPDHHEPLITHELWDAVQEMMKVASAKRKVNHPRRVAKPTLLSGLSYCADCGNMMVYGVANKDYPWRFYMCGKKNREGYAACPSKRIGANNAEAQVMATVLNKILTQEYLSEVITETKKRFGATTEIERQVKAAQREIEDLDIAIQRNLSTIEKTGSEAAQDRLKQRETERAKAKADLDQLMMRLTAAQIEITPEAMEIVLEVWRAQLTQLQEAGNISDLKAWVTQFISRIDLSYNKAKIHYTYPMNEIFTFSQLNTQSARGGTYL